MKKGPKTILTSSFEPRTSNLTRVPRKVPSRFLDVLPYLIGQLHRRAKLFLAPDQLVEEQPDVVVIDVGVEVEDVALDGGRVVFVERRTDADVGHALEGAVEALEARGGDVDAAAGEQLVRRIDVDGGEADLAAEAAAGGDAAVDEVGAAEREIRAADGALGHGIAHDGAGDAHAADADVVDAAHLESEAPAGRFEPRQISLPPRAEAEVASDAHLGHLQRGEQEL